MNAATLKQFFGQVTTGSGGAAMSAIVIALLSGQMTWQQAIPAAVGALVLVLWPEAPKPAA